MASQESWKMGEEGTGSRQSQVPDRPIHCLNNCGFFGSAATMNLCSKCYKELTLSSSSLLASKLPATEPASAAAANNIEAASITVASSSKSMKVENKKKPTNPTIEPASSAASSKSIKIEAEGGSCEESGGGRVRKGKETDVLEEEEEEEPRRRNKNRCYSCHKRVGLTGFKCRCGDLFCAQHRYSDMHNCTFDYKTAARLAIQMANPVVKAPKIHKI